MKYKCESNEITKAHKKTPNFKPLMMERDLTLSLQLSPVNCREGATNEFVVNSIKLQ